MLHWGMCLPKVCISLNNHLPSFVSAGWTALCFDLRMPFPTCMASAKIICLTNLHFKPATPNMRKPKVVLREGGRYYRGGRKHMYITGIYIYMYRYYCIYGCFCIDRCNEWLHLKDNGELLWAQHLGEARDGSAAFAYPGLAQCTRDRGGCDLGGAPRPNKKCSGT